MLVHLCVVVILCLWDSRVGGLRVCGVGRKESHVGWAGAVVPVLECCGVTDCCELGRLQRDMVSWDSWGWGGWAAVGG